MNQHYQQQFNSLLSPGGIQAWKNLKDFCSIPGFYLLSNLLPRHKESSQIYLLLIALLLRKPVSDVPISQLFNLESLDSVFQLSNMDHRHKLKIDVCMDAVNILLTITRILLHPVCTLLSACVRLEKSLITYIIHYTHLLDTYTLSCAVCMVHLHVHYKLKAIFPAMYTRRTPVHQAWDQVHFRVLKYKYFKTFTSTSTSSYLQEVLKYNASTCKST